MIADAKEYSVEEMLRFSRDKMNEKKGYASILENSEIVSRNYQLMQLKTPDFSGGLQMKIVEGTEKIYAYNKFHFIQSLTTHGMHSSIPNYHIWLQEVFQPLATLATST